jgi:hypothetical protein
MIVRKKGVTDTNAAGNRVSAVSSSTICIGALNEPVLPVTNQDAGEAAGAAQADA